ncbi:MAG: dihydropyrimidinase [Tractidigestivibacter sp.]|jgi:dihydropyrimidinase|uniref:dihydropyrimidinase n=1 Tax=Tractidigestivibacter sp. TaxID=2847320 RepID=UPI003D8B719A
MGEEARTVLRGGNLVTPEGVVRGDLEMAGEKILRVVPGGLSEDELAGAKVEDVAGCYVYPGFIDAHTHMQCWTGMDWTADSFETGTRAAACGGTTTIVDYATQDKGMTLTEALDEWHKRADGTCTANYAFHMAIADWNEHTREEIPLMRKRGVVSFKSYFAYDHLRLDDAQTMELLEAIKPFDGILCVHCENGTLVNELQRRMLDQGITGPEGHPLSRPAECEAEAISRLMYLSELTGTRVNVVHLSTKLGLEQVRAAKRRGVRVSVETCPQYLLLDDTRYLEKGEDGFAGAKYVMSPPLRKPADIAALREAVCNGEIDQISTDHCSFNMHGQKDRGRDNFTKIPNGGPGVEHRPALIMTTFEGQLGPMDYLHLLSEGQAKVFGMYPRKGALVAGADADVCVWDPSARWTISAATQHQAVDYTTYEGFEAHGQAHLTYVMGQLAARDGEPTGAKPGQYVSR